MKKSQTIQKEDNEIDYKNSRHRLIQQNRQLYFEIFKLQNKLNQLLTKNITTQFKQKTQIEKNNLSFNEQTQNQISLIKKLKRKILLIKNAQKPQEKQDIRQALDQLAFLKKQKQKFHLQKQALLKKIKPKKEALQLNKPLQGELKNILTLFKSTQRQNNAIKTKLLKLQKEIISLHKIKQSSKNPQSKSTQNHQLEIKVTQNDIQKLKKEIKQIQKQWQPRIQSLNNQYFTLKQIKEEKQQSISDLSKILTNYKNRILVMKQESQILKDKLRLSQIVISPQKRQQINQIYKTQQQKKQFFKQFTQRPNVGLKIISSKTKQQSIIKKVIETRQQKKSESQIEASKIFQTQIVPNKTKKIQKVLEKQTINFNEFEVLKTSSAQILQKNPTKILNSIAVGTTFYYNQEN